MENLELFSLNEQYSTTRLVSTKVLSVAEENYCYPETLLFLPFIDDRKGEGGLRTQGYFKVSLPENPLVTVVTVVFNGEKYLERTILSVINQDYDNIEYIIIDGGSTDSTLDIVRHYEHAIDYWVSEPDKGIYDAMNKGVLCTKGEYVIHLNSDDYFEKNVISRVVSKIKDNPGYDLYHGSLLVHKSSGKSVCRVGHNFLPTSMPAYQPTSFVRVSSVSNLEWFDTDYKIASDFKFFKILRTQNFRFLNINMLITHFSDGGASSNSLARLTELKLILLELGYLPIIVELLLLRIKVIEYLLPNS